jgi:hypothetical protein
MSVDRIVNGYLMPKHDFVTYIITARRDGKEDVRVLTWPLSQGSAEMGLEQIHDDLVSWNWEIKGDDMFVVAICDENEYWRIGMALMQDEFFKE